MIKIHTKNEFKILYQERLKPKLHLLEKTRKKLVQKILQTVLIILLIYMGGSYIFWIKFHNIEFPPTPVILQINLIILFALIVISIFIIKRMSKSYRTLYKSNIVKEIFELVLKPCLLIPDQFITSDQVDKSQLINRKYNRFKGEDYVQGEIDNIKIEFCELRLNYESGSGKNKKNIKIFAGLFFECQFQQSISTPLIIHADQAENLLGQTIGRFFQKNMKKSYQLIELESPEFEKRFAVYGKDQIAARVILNPKTMDQMVQFTKKFKQKIEISLIDDRLYCLLHSDQNHFEPKIFSQSLYWKEVIEIYEILNLVVELINNLKLKQRDQSSVSP